MSAIALVDCNSFYCSCERVFAPWTRGRPVLVLSNNDGCAIAFSAEAKAVGFGQMCEPYFMIKERIKKHKVAVFSSNYALYDDMSRRVMGILEGYTSQLEVYSIDEAFLSLEGMALSEMPGHARAIREDILRRTGLPVGVGVAPTKVLSKVANKLAKKNGGVWVMMGEGEIDEALAKLPVRDLWGVSTASELKLHSLRVKTALEFKRYDNQERIRKLMGVNGLRLQDELRGINCLPMEEAEDKQNIATTRSFGHDVTRKEHLREAVATFCSKAAEKLRAQDGMCASLSVFVQGNRHKDQQPHYGVASRQFPFTADTLKLIGAAHQALDEAFQNGCGYKKAGVILGQIVPGAQAQMDLFHPDPADNRGLGKVMDSINRRFGAGAIKSAGCGLDPSWKLVANHRSKRFTTRWGEILSV